MFDAAYDAILLFDEQGKLVDCNRTALTQLGTTRAVLLSAGLMGFVSPSQATAEDCWVDEAQLHAAIQDTARTGRQFSKWWYGHRADQSARKAALRGAA